MLGQRVLHHFLKFLEMRGTTCRKEVWNVAQKKKFRSLQAWLEMTWLYSAVQTIDQVLTTPGGRDSGRLGSSVRTCLAEAATAADLKGGSGGAKPPQEKA